MDVQDHCTILLQVSQGKYSIAGDVGVASQGTATVVIVPVVPVVPIVPVMPVVPIVVKRVPVLFW